jgi:DNA polymerase-1
MLALIDADLVAYRCAASCKPDEPLDVALLRADKLMRDIIEQVQADSYKAFLTGSENFRRIAVPYYKANRKDEDRPEHLEPIREFLIDEWNAKLSFGCEADDLLAINQTEDSVVCSLDKDLLQIVGNHYSWEIGTATWTKAAKWSVVSDELAGLKTFYKQLMIGDKSDNLTGLDGIGPKKSAKLIDNLENEQEMFECVYDLFEDKKHLFENMLCMWLMRKENETWLDQALKKDFGPKWSEFLKQIAGFGMQAIQKQDMDNSG